MAATKFTSRTNSPAGVEAAIDLWADTRGGATPLDNLGTGIALSVRNESNNIVRVAELNGRASDVTGGTEDSFWEIRNWQAGSPGHADLRTRDTVVTGTKIFKINSRNYVNTSGDLVGLEVGPRATVTTTGEVRAVHAKPNLSDAVSAGAVTGYFSECWSRGTGAGTVDLMRAFYAKVLDDSDGSGSGTKTYTNPVCALWAEANIGASNTFSGKMPVINVVKGPYYDWDALVRFSATSAATKACFVGAMTAKNPESDTEAGYISIYVGSTRYEIPFYAIA